MASKQAWRTTRALSRLSGRTTRLHQTPLVRTFFGGRNWDPFSDLNSALKQMERNSREIEKSLQQFSRGFPFPSPPGSLGNTHRISLDLQGFKPENVSVALKGRLLTIEASMEDKSKDGLHYVSQSITRQYTLPENVDLEKMKSLLSEDGMLCIEAPIIGKNETPGGPKEIPINRSGSKSEESPQG